MGNTTHPTNAAHGVNLESLAKVIAEINPDDLAAAIRGTLAILGMFDGLNDPNSAGSQILSRAAKLATAAWLPESGSYNIPAMEMLLGVKDKTVRSMAANAGIKAPGGKGQMMMNASDLRRPQVPDDDQEGSRT